jgi:hypothetical protein
MATIMGVSIGWGRGNEGAHLVGDKLVGGFGMTSGVTAPSTFGCFLEFRGILPSVFKEI